ncbi:hypothetical protein BT69DRAFT_1284549 [Atractiella rhizophila]|nr:hypothetical protein BT69DRAFT_1284549 [Atractiella rhizophila]
MSTGTPRSRPRTSTHLEMSPPPSQEEGAQSPSSYSESHSQTIHAQSPTLHSRSPPVRLRRSAVRLEQRESGYIPSMDSPSPLPSHDSDGSDDGEGEEGEKMYGDIGYGSKEGEEMGEKNPPRYSYLHPHSPPKERGRASSEPPQAREREREEEGGSGSGLFGRLPFVFNLRRPTLEPPSSSGSATAGRGETEELLSVPHPSQQQQEQAEEQHTQVIEYYTPYRHGQPLSAISEAPTLPTASQSHSTPDHSRRISHLSGISQLSSGVQHQDFAPGGHVTPPNVHLSVPQPQSQSSPSHPSHASQASYASQTAHLQVPGMEGAMGGRGTPAPTIAHSIAPSMRERLAAQGSRVFTPAEAEEQAQMAGDAPPLNFHDLVQIYQVVADRRASFDSLLWQVPTMGLTAHAFLFSIGLASDTSRASRIISMALVLLITFLTIHLFTRQLQAEDADNRWLEDFEKRHHLNPVDSAHGAAWSKYRSVLPPRARHFKHLARLRGFTVWSNGLALIGLVGLGVMLLAIGKPDVLIGCSCGFGSSGGYSKRSLSTCAARNEIWE